MNIKRFTALFMAVIMCFCLCACESTNRFKDYLSDSESEESENIDFSDKVTIVGDPVPETAAPTATPEPTPVPTPQPTPTPIPTAAPTVYIVNNGELTITKNPTGETVPVGGTAKFVAYASNFANMDWILVSPTKNADGNYEAYTAKEAPKYFDGLLVDGAYSSMLVLGNIPAELNGWRAQARFWASGSSTAKYTTGAQITVTGVVPTASPATEQECRDLAYLCRGYINEYAATKGYTTSEVKDFSYSNGTADFYVIITNSICKIEGKFKADINDTYGYYPTHAYVYETGSTSPRDEIIYGSSNDWKYFQNLIDSNAVDAGGTE